MLERLDWFRRGQIGIQRVFENLQNRRKIYWAGISVNLPLLAGSLWVGVIVAVAPRLLPESY
jgi:hypothetical protein